MKPKILIIDHNDSFTFNLRQLFEENSAQVDVISYQSFTNENDLEKYDGFVFGPGPGIPADYPKSLDFIKFCNKPILGVCLGMQIIVTCFGGRLYNLSPVKHGIQDEIIQIKDSQLFRNISFPIKVGRYHSWAMDKNIKQSLIIVNCVTNEGIIMGIEHPIQKIYGVQFHPESYMTNEGNAMIMNWLTIVQSYENA